MKIRLRVILTILTVALLITTALPIKLLAEEPVDESKNESNFLNSEIVQNYFNDTGIVNIPNMLRAAINSGEVYDISQLEKLYNLPEINENSVYIFFILEDYTPVGVISYEITEQTGTCAISGADLIIPDGYVLKDSSETHNVEVEVAEDGTKTFTPNILAYYVKPVMPESVPELNIRYSDNGTTVYVEKKTLNDFEKTTIEANSVLLDRLGYVLGDNSDSNCEYLDILESIFGDISPQTSFIVSLNDRKPLIPSDFLVWYELFNINIPFAISGNTINFEVDKVRDVDLTIDIVFQTITGEQIGNTSHLEMDPMQDYLTVNKDNIPSLPLGYKLADSEESHTAFWEKEDGVWKIEPKTLIFTVVSNQISPVDDNDDVSIEIIKRDPIVLSEVEVISNTGNNLIPLTSDNSDNITLYAIMALLSAGFITRKIINKVKST